MRYTHRSLWVLPLAAVLARAASGKDVPYVPTPHEVVDKMLVMAEVKEGDVVYDLGCGDARIVIAAIQKGAARGVCVEIEPRLVAEGKANAQRAGVADRIRFVEGDLFQVPLADATVVTLYLLPSVNRRLRPRLQAELKPGARVVSHDFDMGEEWTPEQRVEIPTPGHHHVLYRWTIAPAPAAAKR